VQFHTHSLTHSLEPSFPLSGQAEQPSRAEHMADWNHDLNPVPAGAERLLKCQAVSEVLESLLLLLLLLLLLQSLLLLL
jgi:hypothetical protein